MSTKLRCILCCCSAFLPHGASTSLDDNGSADEATSLSKSKSKSIHTDFDRSGFYLLLKIPRSSTIPEIKKAYKKQSLLLHPDKLAQRNITLTPKMQADFIKMKAGYDVLLDPQKRKLYDACGEKVMKAIDDPMSIDRMEIMKNFSNSSKKDRSKIFAIFVLIIGGGLLPFILLCLRADNDVSGHYLTLLTPLWMLDFVILCYHVRMLTMGVIKPPEGYEGEWVDPLPMKGRIFAAFKFACFLAFEIVTFMTLDNVINKTTTNYFLVLLPLYLWEVLNLYTNKKIGGMNVASVEEVEETLGKSFSEMTQDEIKEIEKMYDMLRPEGDEELTIARMRQTSGVRGFQFGILRLIVEILTAVNLNLMSSNSSFSWWLVFLPCWLAIGAVCTSTCYFSCNNRLTLAMLNELDEKKMEKDKNDLEKGYGSTEDLPTVTDSKIDYENKDYENLNDEEKEVFKLQMTNDIQQNQLSCCGSLLLLIPLCVACGRFNGGDYSSLWIIFPLLFAGGVILCCFGCCIFGASESAMEEMAAHQEEEIKRMEREGKGYVPPNEEGLPSAVFGSGYNTGAAAAPSPIVNDDGIRVTPSTPVPHTDILGIHSIDVVTAPDPRTSTESNDLD